MKMKTFRWSAAFLALVLLPLLAACASSDPQGLLREAYRSAQALRGYQIALAQPELLASLPCYCGCGQDPRYKNLKDCFIGDDGAYNSHAANCQVCLEEADDAVAWQGQGLSTQEVRERIDSKYEGRGTPTQTPPLAE